MVDLIKAQEANDQIKSCDEFFSSCHFLNHHPVKYFKHNIVKEKNGEGVSFVIQEFESWEKSVKSKPAIIFVPKTIEGIKSIVKYAAKEGKRVRVSAYRHSSSKVFPDSGDILISTVDLNIATILPAKHPKMDLSSELQGIQLVGEPFIENGKRKIKCKIGSATANYQIQKWVRAKHGGNNQWTLPFNVIMSSNTIGGTISMICHGAGINTKTLSDLVTEIEFINPKGERQIVSDPQQIKAAAGCFGVLGVVTSITLKLSAMEYANLKTVEKDWLALTVPPPVGYEATDGLLKHLSRKNLKRLRDPERIKRATAEFERRCNFDYAEWFAFPLHKKGWSNCWNLDGEKGKKEKFPSKLRKKEQEIGAYIVNCVNELIGDEDKNIAKIQTKLTSYLAMNFLHDKEEIVCSLTDADHFDHGIQNLKTRMMEIEIPIPDKGDHNEPDWSICQKAWWAVLECFYSEKNYKNLPMRTVLEMRVMGGSDILMAPQHGNKRTCSIEILTPVAVDKAIFDEFSQEVLDKWAKLKDDKGNYLNLRPHLAKGFDGLYITRDKDWVKEWSDDTKYDLKEYFKADSDKITIPIVPYLKQLANKEQIKEFIRELASICEQGGYTLKDLQLFSNHFLDDYLFDADQNINHVSSLKPC